MTTHCALVKIVSTCTIQRALQCEGGDLMGAGFVELISRSLGGRAIFDDLGQKMSGSINAVYSVTQLFLLLYFQTRE